MEKNQSECGERSSEIQSATAQDRCLSLPDDLLLNHITTRLPAEAIVRWRWVCKSWRSFITKNFRELTLDYDARNFFASHASESSQLYLYSFNACSNELVERKRLELGSLRPNFHRYLVGYESGLACIIQCTRNYGYWEYRHNISYDIVLWNPHINKVKFIRKSGQSRRRLVLGFGFVHQTGDYKVVKLEFESSYPGTLMEVEIYNLLSDTWKTRRMKTGYGLLQHGVPSTNAFVNGCASWTAQGARGAVRSTKHFIFSFNMMEEQLFDINFPPLARGRWWGPARLTTFQGSLALLATFHGFDQTEMWVMKRYVVAEPWSRVYTVSQDLCLDPIFEIMNDGIILRMTGKDEFTCEDPKTGYIKKFLINPESL